MTPTRRPDSRAPSRAEEGIECESGGGTEMLDEECELGVAAG